MLEQETATHGEDVFSVDGREWMRAVNVSSTALIAYYEAQGTYVQTSQNDFIEVVGYFIEANISTYTFSGNACRITVNGGSEVATSYGSASLTTPLLSRYVDASSIVNLSSVVCITTGLINLQSGSPISEPTSSISLNKISLLVNTISLITLSICFL